MLAHTADLHHGYERGPIAECSKPSAAGPLRRDRAVGLSNDKDLLLLLQLISDLAF